MKITDKDVAYVADLANLELTDQERQRMVRDLNSILDYIDRLNELDTTKVAPMGQTVPQKEAVSRGEAARMNDAGALRQDELRPSLLHEAALANAPDSDGSFFKVPKVIER
jgi:aspartyl-tRNA(Asn)/glutamyl-tRNA(Gln) amidotransferase subunit C